MADQKQSPKQTTQPKQGKPIEIPVPKRSTFDKLVRRAVNVSKANRPK